MLTKSVRGQFRLGLAAAAGLAFASSVLASPPAMHLHTEAGRTHLALAGGPSFHATPDQVLNARAIPLGGGAVAALWEERDALGVRRSFYGVSLDGQRVFRAEQTENLVRLRYASFDPLAGTPGIPEGLGAAQGASEYLVQFVVPPLEPMRDAVRALGGTVQQYLTDQTHVVRIPGAALGAVRDLPFVRWVGPLHPAYKVDGSIVAAGMKRGGAESAAPARYTLQMIERGPAAQETVRARIAALGGTVHAAVPQGFRVDAALTPAQVYAVAAMDEVFFIDPWGPPGNDVNLVRELGGANLLETAWGFNGQGVRAEVLDSGLRATHLALQNPAPLLHNGNFLDTFHGTCVYGIVFGNGAVVPNGRGMLPGREQGIFSSYANLVNRYTHSQELVNPSGQFRAVLQTNSWGNQPTLTYTPISAEMDDIVFDLDLFISQSQSNNGNQQSRPQAWAKNVLSVGGLFHKDTIQRIDDEWIGGASIGPAADGRVKPDVTHFYDKVLATSDLSNIAYTPDFGGTSAATPITAGHAGLIFQMWHEGVFSGFGGGTSVFADRPHFSVVKALLINSAYQYQFSGPTHDLSRDKQGWGMADLNDIIADADRFFIVNESDVLTPLTSKSYTLRVNPDTPQLKVTMTYADPFAAPGAAQARVNDLSLRVTDPNGVIYWGNNGLKDGLWSSAGGVSNKKDTVENVFIPDPIPGVWTVSVLADEVPQDGHVETPAIDADFALVAHPVEFVQPVAISLPAGTPTLVGPGVPTAIDVTISGATQNPIPSSAKIHYRLGSSGSFQTATMQHLGGSDYRAVLPAAVCGQKPRFYFSCQGDGGGTAFEPANAPTGFYVADVGTIQVLYTDDLEGDAGWSVQNTTILTGPWERGIPLGGGLQSDPPADYDGSGKCFTTGLAAGDDVDGGPTVLTSTAYNLTGFSQARISYARWAFTNETGPVDDLKVSISNDNGATWTPVEQVGDETEQWTLRSFPIADYFPSPSSAVRLRFSIADNPANSLTEGGIDAIRITTLACTNVCYADCNQSGTLTIADFGCFQSAFTAAQPYADCNADGQFTIADFGCFQGKFVQGCP